MLTTLLSILFQAATPAPSSTIVEPDWLRRPTGADMAKYYPKAALKEDLAGRAIISCTVDADGKLSACKAFEETPAGAGFGDAAVAAAVAFRMRPQTLDGKPVAGGTVKIPLHFIMPANMRASAARVRHPEIKSEIVELDCRFTDVRLDNCFARGGATAKVRQIAIKLAEELTLPPLPTKRRQGRIVLPLVFADDAGEMATPDVVSRPRWREQATWADVFRAYPEAARSKAPVANVVTECKVLPNGELSECATLSDDTPGEGFGAAALTLMPKFRLDEVDAFGLKVAGRKVRVRIRFSPAAPPPRPEG